MDDHVLPPDDDDAAKIADAESLFRTSPSEAPKATRRAESPDEGQYEMEGPTEDPREVGVTPPIPPTSGLSSQARTARPEAKGPGSKTPEAPPATVTQVWSRGAEWAGSLVGLAVAAFGLLLLVYVLISMGMLRLGFLTLVVGMPVVALLSYPILITLERPVRVTPEQAVRDFYTALSHHVPHYRRMWLLLSDAGRVGDRFASFEGFRDYWKGRLVELRAGRAPGYTPLKFQVENFKSEKSAGKSEIPATFTVLVSVRGRQQEGPVESVRVSSTLVKGPDRMWYLNKGTLP